MNNEIRVIIVDDDPVVLTLVSRFLGDHPDLRIVGAFANGRDAVAAATAERPDVMIVDISMPAMSGAEVARRVLETDPQIRVMAYTSLADARSLSEMMRAGASGVVYKDASIEAVADAIRATRSGLSVNSPRFVRHVDTTELNVQLSDTEKSILRLVSRGLTNDQIGRRIHLTTDGVKYHIGGLIRKLDATNRVTLAVMAVRLGLTDADDPTPATPAKAQGTFETG